MTTITSADNDPFVERIIRLPGATITLKGPLSRVDETYRTCTKALLDSGRYKIPRPDEADPWGNFSQAQSKPEPDVNFLQRRNMELEQQLQAAHDSNGIQDLRHENTVLKLQVKEWKEAFVALNANVLSALRSLSDDPDPNLYAAVARTFLE